MLENSKLLGTEHLETLETMFKLARAQKKIGNLDQALQLFSKVTSSFTKVFGAAHPRTQESLTALAGVYVDVGQTDKALLIYKEILSQTRRGSRDDVQELSSAMENVGKCLLQLERWVEAEKVLDECQKIRKAKIPDQRITFETMGLLGTSLYKRKKYAQAESLLTEAHTGLSQGLAENPDSKHKLAVDSSRRQLVDLYKDWGKPDEASKWERQK